MPLYHYIAQCQTTCCPTITVDTDKQLATITDDFGGSVAIPVEQMKLLIKFFEKTVV